MTIQVPEPVGSSGQFLESFIVSSSQHRQVLVLGNSANTAVAPVTTSGGLRTNVSSGVLSISSGVVTLSSMPALSSGVVTLSSVHTVTATAATNPWSSAPSFEIPFVSASSGLVQISGTPTVVLSSIPSLSSGTVTLSSAPLVIVASSGGTIPVTLSTVVSLSSAPTVTATAATNPWSSAPSFNVPVVTASSGLYGTIASTAQQYTAYAFNASSSNSIINLTTAPAILFSWNVGNQTTGTPASIKLFNSTTATVGSTSNLIITIPIPGSTAGSGNNKTLEQGVLFSGGITALVTNNFGATSTGTSHAAGDVVGTFFYV